MVFQEGPAHELRLQLADALCCLYKLSLKVIDMSSMVLLTFALVLEHFTERYQFSLSPWWCDTPDAAQFIGEGVNIGGMVEQALPGALGADLWWVTLAITVNLTCRDIEGSRSGFHRDVLGFSHTNVLDSPGHVNVTYAACFASGASSARRMSPTSQLR